MTDSNWLSHAIRRQSYQDFIRRYGTPRPGTPDADLVEGLKNGSVKLDLRANRMVYDLIDGELVARAEQ